MAVYESLVTACLERSGDRGDQEDAFAYIEHAKSRSLADLIAFRATTLAPRVAGPATEDVRRLRQQLNWHYRQIELEQLGQEAGAARRSRPSAAARADAGKAARRRARRGGPDRPGILRAADRHLGQPRRDPRDPARRCHPPRVPPGARTVLRLRPDAGPSPGGAPCPIGGGPQSPAPAAVSTLEAPPGAGLRRRVRRAAAGRDRDPPS